LGGVQESGGPEWLHTLSMGLTHLADYGEWVESVGRPGRGGIIPREPI
jgi:hypothetical protein